MKMMTLSLYGEILLRNEKTKKEGRRLLRISEEMGKVVPFWWQTKEHLFLPEFNLTV